jgi:N-acetylglucosamine-6-phosphate deacetylase
VTIAGSVLTMDRAFQTLVGRVGISLVDAATICATTAARELGLVGYGVLAPDAIADLVVLDANFMVVQTYLGGQLAYSRNTQASSSV